MSEREETSRRPRRADAPREIDPVDEAGKESFPGSDPPAWVPLRAGAPVEPPDEPRPDEPRPDDPR